MNNPAYEETQNNLREEAHYARVCVEGAADDVLNGRDIHSAAVDWGVPVSEITRFLEEK